MLANTILWTMINKEIHFPLLIITNSTWNSLIFKDRCHPTIKVLAFSIQAQQTHAHTRFAWNVPTKEQWVATRWCRDMLNFMQSFIYHCKKKRTKDVNDSENRNEMRRRKKRKLISIRSLRYTLRIFFLSLLFHCARLTRASAIWQREKSQFFSLDKDECWYIHLWIHIFVNAWKSKLSTQRHILFKLLAFNHHSVERQLLNKFQSKRCAYGVC